MATLFAAPLCDDHMVEAWRYVEARPNLRPDLVAVERQIEEIRTHLVHAVYYVRLRHGDIKIGVTNGLAKRTGQLRLDWPDDVLAAEWGGYKLEHARHRQFAAERRSGRNGKRTEDFAPSDRLLAHVATVRDDCGEPLAMNREMCRINAQLVREATSKRAAS
jgi:hypothetical protein